MFLVSGSTLKVTGFTFKVLGSINQGIAIEAPGTQHPALFIKCELLMEPGTRHPAL